MRASCRSTLTHSVAYMVVTNDETQPGTGKTVIGRVWLTLPPRYASKLARKSAPTRCANWLRRRRRSAQPSSTRSALLA